MARSSKQANKGVLLAFGFCLTASTAVFAQNQSLPPMPYGAAPYNGGYQQQYQQQYQQPQQYQQYNNGGYQQSQTYQGRVSTVPSGTPLSATVSTPLSSEFSRVGDRFMASLGSPITGSDGSIVIPAGSQLEGQVVSVKPAGRTGKAGELDVRFTAAVLGNGQRIPLSARIRTDDNTGIIKGSTTAGRVGNTALKTGLGAGLGAALGTAMGPLSGGNVGRGAIYGTAIGGGLGLAKGAWDKGKDAVLQTGEPLNIMLDQPITVTPQSGYNNNYNGNSGGNYNNGGGYSNYGGSDNGAFTPYGN